MERYLEIERLIITTYRSRLWAKFIKAIKEYELIQENDKICVCISGGKDSMLLAKLFQELKRHSDFHFDVKYLVMNPGYNQKNLDLIKKNLGILNIDAVIEETNIFEVASAEDKNPCYLCARMRRGALYRLARDLGCNKIALGHHYDDVIETTLMNMLNSGSLQTMLPKLKSTNYEGMDLIRPMYLIREKDIKAWKNASALEFLQCACKLTEALVVDETVSQRYQTKKLISELTKYNPLVEKNIFKCTENVNLNMMLGYKLDGVHHSFLDAWRCDDAVDNKH